MTESNIMLLITAALSCCGNRVGAGWRLVPDGAEYPSS